MGRQTDRVQPHRSWLALAMHGGWVPSVPGWGELGWGSVRGPGLLQAACDS